MLSAVAMLLTVAALGTPATDRAAQAVTAATPAGNPASRAAALRLYIHRNVDPLKLVNGVHPSTAEGVLAEGSGACGNQVQAYLAVAPQIGLQARPVEFYEHPDNAPRASHDTVEVFWAGGWHLEDITWNTVYRLTPAGVPLSVDALMKLSPQNREKARRTGKLAFPAVRADYIKTTGDPFAYIHGPTDVIVDHAGTVTASAAAYPVPNIPNFIGHTLAEDGTYGNLSLQLTSPAGTLQLTGSAACAGGGALVATTAAGTTRLPLDSSVFAVATPGTVTLTVDGQGSCYLVVASVS